MRAFRFGVLAAFSIGHLSAPALRAAAPDEHANAAALEILDHALDAMGGEAALQAVKSAHFEATDERNPASPTWRIWIREPGDAVVRSDRFDRLREDGCNGAAGWHIVVQNNQYVCTAARAPREDLRRQCFIHRIALDLADQRPMLAAGEDADVKGHRCRVIVADEPDGRRTTYFDAQTGLPAAMAWERKYVGTFSMERTEFEDWREVDGLKIPFLIVPYAGSAVLPSSMRITKAEFNHVDESVFETPAAAQELLRRDSRPARSRQTDPPPDLADEQIAALSREDAMAALARIADARQFTAGDPERDDRLKRQMQQILLRIRQLKPDVDPQPLDKQEDPPPPLTREQIDKMDMQACRAWLIRLSEARKDVRFNPELEERLKREMAMVFARMKQLKSAAARQ